jgi:CRP/FNR family nitrogen fixation transcriptional regulator
MSKHEQTPVGLLCANLPNEQTLKCALAALQRGPIRFRRNHVIGCEGDTADYIFLVADGVLRTCKTFQNGQRAVIAFYLPGDLFGWDDETRRLSIEAASDAMVILIKSRGLAALAASNTRLADFLRATVAKQLQRAQEHATTISMSAKDRFLTFLHDWLKRSGSSGSVHFSIGYQHIVDHLGIKIETLSRTITQLERSGALARTSSRGTLTLREPLMAA